MSTYTQTRDATLLLRDALQPRSRAPKGTEGSAFSEDRRQIRSFFSDPNVLGFGVTEKVVAGKPVAGQFSLTFHVRRKLPKNRLTMQSFIPKRLRLHSRGASVQTDIQQVGSMHVAHAGLTSGSSIGHVSGAAGTVTLIGKDSTTQEELILSCSHVLALCGAAQRGDEVESPAFASGGSSPEVVGQLTDRFMVINPSVFNTIDAALASPVDGTSLSNNIPGLGDIAGVLDLRQVPDQSAINLPVAKFGASTALKFGQITGVHFTLQIRFPEMGDQVVSFTDLLTHNIPAEEGDSGAAVVDSATLQVIGMHIAGTGQSGLCTNIQPVLDTLQIGL
jgi:hypothetical protein